MTKTKLAFIQRQKDDRWWDKRYVLMTRMGMTEDQIDDYMTAYNPKHWSDKYRILLPHINQIKELTK